MREGTTPEAGRGHVCRPGRVASKGGVDRRRLAMSARRRRPDDGAPQVIVVGAGFAGLAAVKALDRTGAQVMLVDQNIYSTFQPLLYQVATGGLNPGDVAFPLRVLDRKSTRLNSSHLGISYAVFCLKKKTHTE